MRGGGEQSFAGDLGEPNLVPSSATMQLHEIERESNYIGEVVTLLLQSEGRK